MAWIKAQDYRLYDVGSVFISPTNSMEVHGRASSTDGWITLGKYSNHKIAKQVKDGIHAWLNSTGGGVWTMPDKDYLCEEEKSCKTCAYGLHGCSYGSGPICSSCNTGHTNWKPIGFVNCTVCGREGGPNAGTICPSCRKKASRPCEDCENRGLIICFACSSDTHSHWNQRTVLDVKVFPAHDASKPINGVVQNTPGEILEVIVGDETLTCKVLKVVRKGSHGIFTMELKE